jgi:hypothetical protein
MEESAFNSFLRAIMTLFSRRRESRMLFRSEHMIVQGLMEEQMRTGVRGLQIEQVEICAIPMADLQGLGWVAVEKALQEVDALANMIRSR